jgi:hypothetical protein
MRGWHLLQHLGRLQHNSGWRELLPYGEEMEDVLLDFPVDMLPNEYKATILNMFIRANESAARATGHLVYATVGIRLNKYLIGHLQEMRNFAAQADAISDLANIFLCISENEDAKFYFQKLRDLGAEMGCFRMECMSCIGLGGQALLRGFQTDGIDLLRNALIASSLLLPSDNQLGHEIVSLQALTDALFDINNIDEVEPLVLRMALLAKDEQNDSIGKMQFKTIFSMIRLHEARDRPKEAADEVRTLVDLVYRHRVKLSERYSEMRHMLVDATEYLKILHPETGDKQLTASLQRAIVQDCRPMHLSCPPGEA